MTIRFTILGNQEDPHGNAIPKVKLTRGQQWTPKAQRYAGWKDYVRLATRSADVDNYEGRTVMTYLGQITGTPDATMTLAITWANEKHADAESVFGSIADALFENDKHVAGSFSFVHAKDKTGRVDVEVTM